MNPFGAFSALFTATFILLTGNGMLNTLLSARMAVEGFSTVTSGIILSCYFTGLLTGSFVCHRLIQRVGHIRAFAVFAGTITAAALLHGLYFYAWFWGALRFVSGIVTFGLYMVIESWLNECTESRFRGRVFSIYMILTYLGIGIGQHLVGAGNIWEHEPFIIAGIMFAFCLVPVSATQGISPRLPQRKAFSLMAIVRKAPLGMLGTMAAGLTNSAIYAMTPVLCTKIGLPIHQMSWVMSVTVFCGLAAQLVVGSLSDRFDRTIVLGAVASAITVFSGFIFIIAEASFWGVAVSMGVFGALAFTVYPVSVARAHDVFSGQDTVAVSAGLLFTYSIGASISPLVASGMMTLLKTPFGLYAFWCLVNGCFAVAALYLRKREKAAVVPVQDQVAIMPMKSTSPVVMALDPRSDFPKDEQPLQ